MSLEGALHPLQEFLGLKHIVEAEVLNFLALSVEENDRWDSLYPVILHERSRLGLGCVGEINP